MIIGLTGTMGSGKEEVSLYLQQRGFQCITLSSLIREEAEKRNLPIEREILQNMGNELTVTKKINTP